MTNAYKIVAEKSDGKRPLGRSKHRWEDYIRMDLRSWAETRGLNSSGSGQRPVACSCERDNESSGSIKGIEFLNHLDEGLCPMELVMILR
jgi:hypothetical protein